MVKNNSEKINKSVIQSKLKINLLKTLSIAEKSDIIVNENMRVLLIHQSAK